MPVEDADDRAVDTAIDAVDQGNAVAPTPQPAGLPDVNPDVAEQELGGGIDNIVPTRGYELPPMVGLGGSAGGIQALTGFFEAMPADSGLVFVVVLHLSPEHESTLAELLARHTTMPVVQAEDGMTVAPNHVYVIPPRKYLASVDGHLRLSPLEPAPGRRMTVDVFFRTLADTHGAHAAAIVLSGADGDGAIGIKRIKERGGLTVAQDPARPGTRGCRARPSKPAWSIGCSRRGRCPPTCSNTSPAKSRSGCRPKRSRRRPRSRRPTPRRRKPTCARRWLFCTRTRAGISPATSAPPSCAASPGVCKSTGRRAWRST